MTDTKCFVTHIFACLFEELFKESKTNNEIRCVWNLDKEG